MSSAMVNPAVLIWSRQRACLSEGEIAAHLQVKEERILEWEKGEEKPTFKQAQRWADVVHVPFGFLFLQDIPADELPIPDLRTVGNLASKQVSLNLLETIKGARRKQQWFIEYAKEHNYAPLPFVGKFDLHKNSISEVVTEIKNLLPGTKGEQRPQNDEYIKLLIEQAESAGILVMRSRIVGANTHRKLNVEEFRGFAMCDAFAPLIFINTADAPTARLFTLLHEIAHLLIGCSSISDEVKALTQSQEERFCNTVAGEFLAPKNEFLNYWNNGIPNIENFNNLSQHFRLSKLAVAKRSYDLALISEPEYSEYYSNELQKFRGRNTSGGSYYRNLSLKNSHRLCKAVLVEALSGRMLLRDAANLLGLQASKIKTFAYELGI